MKAEALTHETLIEWGNPISPAIAVTGIALRDETGLRAVMAVYDVTDADFSPLDEDDPVRVRFERARGWWAGMDSRGPVSPLAHRYALKVKKALQDKGIKCVYADADPSIFGSSAWLQRIGFVPYIGDIWRCDLVLGDGCGWKPDAGRAGKPDWKAAQECGL